MCTIWHYEVSECIGLTSVCGKQRLVKRSMCMLQKPEYQLLYCSEGLASGAELEDLKIMRASQQFGF